MAKRSIGKPVRQSSGTKAGGKGWLGILLLIALGGGGYYGYDAWQNAENNRKAEEAARRSGADASQKLADELARMAEERDEQDRLAAEEEARRKKEAEEEALRQKAAEEEAERLRRMKENETTDTPAPVQQTEEPGTDTESIHEPSIYDKSLPLHGSSSIDSNAKKQFKALIDNLLEKRDFDVFEKAMAAKIMDAMAEYTANGKLSYGHYKNRPNLVQTVELCLLTRYAGAKELAEIAAQKGNGVDNRGVDFFQWLLRDRARPLHLFMQNYAYQEGLPSNMAHSLRQLYTIWSEMEEEDDRAKYVNLAIAGSLMIPEITTDRGRYRDEQATILSVPEICAYLRERDKNRKLATDIKKLSVSQLIHVVDVRLPQEEISWVEENINYTQATWGEAYGSVRYLMERAANDEDPYELYSFEELRKEGGVCRDQAYFACNTAKCCGVPAVYVVGDGDRGPHAWMVHLKDSTTWVQTNSYGYNSGQYNNPCSGRSQHEMFLLSRTEKTTDDKLAAAADSLVLANYLISVGDPQKAHNVAAFIPFTYPTETVAWSHYIRILGHDAEHQPPASVWRKITADLTRLGKKNYELLGLAAEVEDKYLFAGRKGAGKQSAMRRAMNQLNKHGGDERADLVLNAINRQAEAMMETKNYSGLGTFYRKHLKKYASRTDLFAKLLEQYMGYLEPEASARVWNILARDAEKIFERNVKSGGGDFFRLQKEVEIQQMIANAWEKAGNVRKYEKHRQEAEERLSNAKEKYKSEEE